MGWQDRNYSPGRENANAYFSNPALALQYALPIYTSRSLTIRLHFWFLLFALFDGIETVREGFPFFYIPLHIIVMLAAVLFHELGHRIFARAVGGDHWEWVVWPLGGMNPPRSSREPWPLFVANFGGWIFSFALLGAAIGAAFALPYTWGAHFLFMPMHPADVRSAAPLLGALPILSHCLAYLIELSAAICVINLFPCYWFDGGNIWQSILSPRLGSVRAATTTCMAGMILSVPALLLSLYNGDIFGLFVWVMVFSDCFNRRRALLTAGPMALYGEEDDSYAYMNTPDAPRKKPKPGLLKAAKKRRALEAQEQAKIDAILAKVHEQGLHSLTWSEKRTLKKATDRQRKRDTAARP